MPELVGGSATSPGLAEESGFPEQTFLTIAAQNPHITFSDFRSKGYGVVDVSPTGLDCQLKKVQIATPDGGASAATIASYHVPLGARTPAEDRLAGHTGQAASFVTLPRAVDFKLTDEQRDFVAAIRDFCERECGTQEKREQLTKDHTEHHNPTLYKQMAELGWLGVTIPEEYGGSGGSMLDACLFMEETSRGLAPIGGYATTLIVAGATKRFGTEEQKQEILGGIAEGSVEAIAMTEPESGSDVGSLSTEAERFNGGFVINGQKVFISNAHISDHVLVVCRTTKGENKHEGLSMIFVPKDTEGMEMQPIDTMGGRETNTVYFNDCEVPAERCSARTTRAGPS